MDREVLNSSGLLSQLGRGFVAVKINSDQHPELIDQYDIRALPSDVFVDPSGRVIAQSDGFQDLRTYQARLASIERAFLDATRVHIAGGGSGETPVPSPQGPAILQPSITPNDSPEGPRDGIDRSAVDVGLGGYSPISLWNERAWRKGSPEFASSHKGVVYFMASARELQQFQAAPERYAPQLLGCDPVILSESKRAVKGSPEYGAYFGGMLYLFVSMETRARFAESPQRFSGSQHTLRINQIERRLVRVSERPSEQQTD
jgi:YHS domain-containing protein